MVLGCTRMLDDCWGVEVRMELAEEERKQCSTARSESLAEECGHAKSELEKKHGRKARRHGSGFASFCPGCHPLLRPGVAIHSLSPNRTAQAPRNNQPVQSRQAINNTQYTINNRQ